MWVAPADQPTVEEALFRYLSSVRAGAPRADRPVVVDRETLRALYASPHPDLVEALRHCVDAFLVEAGPDPASWGTVEVAPGTLGVALAGLNCLTPMPPPPVVEDAEEAQSPRDPVGDFTAALIATLPPARTRDAALAYHAVLRGTRPSPDRARLFHALLERSPLTALDALELHTPRVLNAIAADLLPGWRPDGHPGGDVWASGDGWLDAAARLLDDERLARWLRHRWLALPDTRPACRNLGLLLEALRRRGDHRDLLLQFYEAYDYFRGQRRPDGWGGTVRVWPVLPTIEKLLRTPGDSEAAMRVNRWGNEMLLLFRPLIEIVVAEGVVPTDYAHLSREFVLALRPLLDYATESGRQQIEFGEVEFEEGEE
jgi:hypothetical protein